MERSGASGRVSNANQCCSPEIFKSAIQHGVLEWLDLPMNIRGNVDFALSLTDELVLPDERKNANQKQIVLWGRIIDTLSEKPNSNLALMIATYAPSNVLSDYHLMLTACKGDPAILNSIDQSLLFDRQFVESLLEAEPLALVRLPQRAQLLFPDLVVKAFGPLCQQSPRMDMAYAMKLSSHIAQELWRDRHTILQWYAAGLPFIDNRDSGTWCQDDREISMLIARNCCSEFRAKSFSQSSPILREDKAFMLKILTVDATLYLCMPDSVKLDFDLSVLAFSGSSKTIEFKSQDGAEGKKVNDHVSVVMSQVTQLLELYDTFHATVLCGMSHGADGSKSSTLAALDQGTETLVYHKRMIAAYLGIPTGDKLAILRRASANILEMSRRNAA